MRAKKKSWCWKTILGWKSRRLDSRVSSAPHWWYDLNEVASALWIAVPSFVKWEIGTRLGTGNTQKGCPFTALHSWWTLLINCSSFPFPTSCLRHLHSPLLHRTNTKYLEQVLFAILDKTVWYGLFTLTLCNSKSFSVGLSRLPTEVFMRQKTDNSIKSRNSPWWLCVNVSCCNAIISAVYSQHCYRTGLSNCWRKRPLCRAWSKVVPGGGWSSDKGDREKEFQKGFVLFSEI